VLSPRLPSWLGAAATGVLLVLAFAPVEWFWCGWVALAPLWIALRCDAGVRRHPLRYGFLAGTVWVCGSFWWMAQATVSGFIMAILVLGFYPAWWLMLAARFLPVDSRHLGWRGLLYCAGGATAFWVTLEWWRTWFFSGFAWNDLGVSQTPCLHLRQLAALGGASLLSAMVVVVNILLAEGWLNLRGRQWRSAAGLLAEAMAVLLGSWFYGWVHLRGLPLSPVRSLSYACIQPDIAQLPYANGTTDEIALAEGNAFDVLQELSVQAAALHPDLLIWPEAVTCQRLGLDSVIDRAVGSVRKIYPGPMLLGSEEYTEGRLYNCAYLLVPGESAIQRYRKVHLVVVGEYLPWEKTFPWLRDWWGGGISFSRGPGAECFRLPGGVTFSPFICFEDTLEERVQDAATVRPDFFVTLTNESWYSGLGALWELHQHLQNAVLPCVEHDRPLIRCANNGITAEIDASGGVVDRVRDASGGDVGVRGILFRQLSWTPAVTTLFEIWGDWVTFCCQAASLIFLLKKWNNINAVK
jgi:apolipoprotein N-acyltransferase